MGHVHSVLNVNTCQEEAIIKSLYIFPWFIILMTALSLKQLNRHNLNGYFHRMLNHSVELDFHTIT